MLHKYPTDDCAGDVIDAALAVHTRVGSGLLESAYQAFLACELGFRGFDVRAQVPVPAEYRGVRVDVGYRIDLLVAGSVIVELKAVNRLLPIHEAQVISYLRLSGLRVGLLINFHSVRLKDGIRRFVNNA